MKNSLFFKLCGLAFLSLAVQCISCSSIQAQNLELTQKLFNTIGATDDDQMGYSISIDNGIAVVGVVCSDHGSMSASGVSYETCGSSPNRGAVYIFAKDQGGTDNWGLVKKIINGIGTDDITQTFININGNNGDVFGFSVAISGDLIAVGAPNDDQGGTDRGAAYIFAKNQGGTDHWGLVKKIVNGSGVDTSTETFVNVGSTDGAFFGWAVTISGNTLAVGSPKDVQGGSPDFGAVYLFDKDQGGTDHWGLLNKIINGSGVGDDIQTFVNIGTGLSNIFGVFIVGDAFGWSVALSDTTLIVGANGDGQGGFVRGAAYVFTKDLGKWFLVKKIIHGSGINTATQTFVNVPASDGASFGWFVDISGDQAVVGAPLDESNRGTIAIFAKDQGGTDQWGLVKKIYNRSGTNTATTTYLGTNTINDQFGYAVGISGNTVVASAMYDISAGFFGIPGLSRGDILIFDKDEGGTNNWGLSKTISNRIGTDTDTELFTQNGSNTYQMGYALAIWEDIIAAGVPREDQFGTDRGAAYIFTRTLISLPTYFLAFSAQRVDLNTVSLSWISYPSENNPGFIIEQSQDAVQFDQVAWVDARQENLSTAQTYQYTIQNKDAAYYRVKQSDTQGDFSYSPVQFVAGGELTHLLGLYPNPSNGLVYLLPKGNTSNLTLTLTLLDPKGHTLWQFEGTLSEVEKQFHQVLPGLSTGMYFVQIHDQHGSQLYKMLRYE
ncbi:MAG: FG-GAP repeat protein [Microscillaceae bacterium]|nr:FG-GAP repeat protein [Microscillaceae bacterium]